MPRKQARMERDQPSRIERLGFRLDEKTKDLIERAAAGRGHRVSDVRVTALAAAAGVSAPRAGDAPDRTKFEPSFE